MTEFVFNSSHVACGFAVNLLESLDLDFGAVLNKFLEVAYHAKW